MGTTSLRRHDPYPSRVVAEPSITARRDPVVHGAGIGLLGPAQVRTFAEQGFLVVPGLLGTTELRALHAELEALRGDDGVKRSEEAIVEPDGDELRSLFAVHRHDGALGRLAADPRLAGMARQLLGSDVYVHQSRVNLKPGFRGKEFWWHSDFETWHTEDGMPRMRAVSAAVSLTDNHPWNGPLLTIAGSHLWYVSCVGETPDRHYEASLRRQEIGVPDDDSLRELCRRGRIEQCVGPAGSVVLFECNLMHGSNGNITPEPRCNVFVVYNSVENALEEPFAAPAPRPEHIASRTFEPV